MKARGYTLVELLVVLAVLGLLAGMAMPLAQTVSRREQERELKRSLWQIRDAIDAWHQACVAGALEVRSQSPCFPPDLEALERAYPDRRTDRKGTTLRFIRQLPRDPLADSAIPAHQTWGIRSYASEAHAPLAGVDVYDIFSRNTGTGLNGIPYARW